MERLVPPLDAGEYGRMPPHFYENSQLAAPTDSEDAAAETTTNEIQSVGEVPDAPTVDQTRLRPARGPILPRDKWDGVDSDDETDEEDLHGDGPFPSGEGAEDEEEEEDRPQVVGDIEIDMEDEQEEFLEFAREALGLSDEQWQGIVRDRLQKGGESRSLSPFGRVPCVCQPLINGVSCILRTQLFGAIIIHPKTARSTMGCVTGRGADPAYVPTGLASANTEPQPSSSSSSRIPGTIPDPRIFKGSLAQSGEGAAAAAGSPSRQQAGSGRDSPRRLDTFESVMDAMDEELARVRNLRAKQPGSHSGLASGNSPAPNKTRGSAPGDSKGKERAVEVENIDAEMDAELHASLHAGESEDEEDEEAPEPGDYRMIKNFLESFKAQGGLAGPVSTLAGRLEPGWRIPRDEQ